MNKLKKFIIPIILFKALASVGCAEILDEFGLGGQQLPPERPAQVEPTPTPTPTLTPTPRPTPRPLLPATRYDAVEIEGDEQFVSTIETALELLRQFPEYYELANTYIGRIERGRGNTHIEIRRETPVMRVNAVTSEASSLWIAGMIVHEAYHSKLYFEYFNINNRSAPSHVWGRPDGEVMAIERQRGLLVAAQAPQHYIQHVDNWLVTYREQALERQEAEREAERAREARRQERQGN